MSRLTRRSFIAAGGAAVALGCTIGNRKRLDADAREVAFTVAAVPTREGAGVNLVRTLGSGRLRDLDPFLLLDEIHSDRPEDWRAGFPDHPHRGFETVSYLIDGAFEHRDSAGNAGIIASGGAQWMTAGRGIIHSEMPTQEPGRDLWGLQLWVNLPARLKMSPPRYQDLDARVIPEVDVADARVRVVAGAVGRTRGPVDGIAALPTLVDVTLPAGARFHHELPAGHTAFVYMLAGAASVGLRATEVPASTLAVLSPGRDVDAVSASGGRFLLVAAAPFGEPIARRGPFVMNTDEEIAQAFADYRAGRLAR